MVESMMKQTVASEHSPANAHDKLSVRPGHYTAQTGFQTLGATGTPAREFDIPFVVYLGAKGRG